MKMDDVVGRYVQLRDKKREIERLHKEKTARINEVLYKLENLMLEALNHQGADSVATPAGTVYKKETTRAKVEDWEASLAYIKEHGMWHVLPHSVNSTAIQEFVQETGDSFPGVSLNKTLNVGIRRKS